MPEKIIAVCGLICSECPAYLATQAGDRQKAQETADIWSSQYKHEIKIDDVWCDGCTQGERKCSHCGECEIRACGLDKGVENCARCDEYPCEQLNGFFKMVPQAQENLDSLRVSAK